MNSYRFGPVLTASGVTFRIWAPRQAVMRLLVEGSEPQAMEPLEDGWHALTVAGIQSGQRYRFVLEDGLQVPDPGSRFQPEDVHGASEIIDPDAYTWQCADWKGRPWHESVIYEAHVGTLTPEGTFLAAIDRLDYLKELGVTVLQLMPVADFPGRRGWGYDGVLPYAPESSYGRPEDLKALVDAAHMRGISVFLDVVYNHFGPDGNYLPHYANFFTERHQTPWGDGLNFDGGSAAAVRAFVSENARFWIEEFRFDGLRLDAVHAILDDSDHSILHEIAEDVRAVAGDRHVHLVVENEDNDADLMERDPDGTPKHYEAQWADDIHHVLHRAATGQCDGYYADYGGGAAIVGKALAEGFVFQGELMPEKGRHRGKPSAHLPPTAFISFIQNHDQVGNRMFGDRLGEMIDTDRLGALASIYLLAPEIPLLFMGEEWAASSRFPFFCDFDDALNAAVREGRKREFGHDPNQAGNVEEAPDPTTEGTFLSAKLRWDERETGRHGEMLAHYRRLLALRHAHVVPLLAAMGDRPAEYSAEGGRLEVRWHAGERSLILAANLGEAAVAATGVTSQARCIFPGEGQGRGDLAPWDVRWFVL